MRERTWAVVDLGAIARNFKRIQEHVGEHVGIMGVVKANAYGHGAVQVARVLEHAGAKMLGVGDSSEAIELREQGITLPIVILGAISEREVEDVVHYRITPTVHSLDRVKRLAEEAKKQNVTLDVNILVDTGMGRLGVKPESAAPLAESVLAEPTLRLMGASTHFATSHWRDKTFMREQFDKFGRVLRSLHRKHIHVPHIHTASSAAIFSFRESHLNLVRPGIALYGMDPGNFDELGVKMEPALSLKTTIVFLKGVRPNTPISYNCTYQTFRSTKIATCPIGYNDGFSYALSNIAYVLVRGRRAPVVGQVTMDYIMIDVGHIPGVQVNDEVTIIGADGASSITAEELAKLRRSIPYEVTCSLGKRVKRVYVNENAAEAVARQEERKTA